METTIKAFCYILILTSCSHSNEKVKVNLLNISKIKIDSIVISINKSKLNFMNINANQTQKLSKSVDLKKSGVGQGAFVISIYANDSLKNSGTFGYFSNPSEIKSEYTVTIFDDLKFREN